MAPIFWVALHERPGVRRFPSQLSHTVLLCILNMIASGLYGLRIGNETLNPHNMFILSISIFSFSVLLLYLATVYDISRIDASAELKNDENNFANDFKNRRKNP